MSSPEHGSYCPDIDEFVWLDFDPQSGREQSGRRPALVLSPKAYNAASGLCVLCPVTSRIRGYPFEVLIPFEAAKVFGVVLADQVKSLSWERRYVELIGPAPRDVCLHVRAKIKALLAIG